MMNDLEYHIAQAEIANSYGFIYDLIRSCPERIPQQMVDEFITNVRVMPAGTPHPGKWRNNLTPYLPEIMNCMAATSRLEEICFVKSTQVGATACIENIIAYIIKVNPGPTMYMSANDNLLKKWIAKRLAPLLMSCGLSEEIRAQHLMKGQRRTGNTQFSKEFPGGSLEMVTVNSAANLRSDSIQNVLMDEVDGYPKDVGGEGSPKAIAEARTDAYENKKKIMYVSTPTTEAESNIWPIFENGDQRRFFVPCPHCKERMLFKWTDEEADFGLRWDLVKGQLDERSIAYICEHCHKPITENYKYGMLQMGKWIPTSQSYSRYAVSFHIDALSSLLTSWKTIIQKWLKVVNGISDLRTFYNTVLGIPFREVGERPKAAAVYEVRGDYKRGTVLDDTLFLTAGIDVQRGSKRNKQKPRIEMEIVGHAYGFKTQSVDYKVFNGSIDDPYDGAWQAFDEWAQETKMVYTRNDGRQFGINLVLVDSGDGQYTDIVYRFAERYQNVFACRGAKPVDLGVDPRKPESYRRYRKSKIGEQTVLYLIHSTEYKEQLYNSLKIKRKAGAKQANGFCDFPNDYIKAYFDQLTAQERLADGSFYLPRGRRDEALSCRVMAMAAAHIFLDQEVKLAQAYHRQLGKAPEWINNKINMRYIIESMKKAIL